MVRQWEDMENIFRVELEWVVQFSSGIVGFEVCRLRWCWAQECVDKKGVVNMYLREEMVGEVDIILQNKNKMLDTVTWAYSLSGNDVLCGVVDGGLHMHEVLYCVNTMFSMLTGLDMILLQDLRSEIHLLPPLQ